MLSPARNLFSFNMNFNLISICVCRYSPSTGILFSWWRNKTNLSTTLLFPSESLFHWKFTQDLWNLARGGSAREELSELESGKKHRRHLDFFFLGIIICLGWKINLGKFYPESWNKFLFRRFLLSPGRKMASVAVDPQLVWILKCYFLISFPFCVFWEVNSSPLLTLVSECGV